MIREALAPAGRDARRRRRRRRHRRPGPDRRAARRASRPRRRSRGRRGLPLVPVDHLHGHVASLYLEPLDLEPPFTCLLASGGHTLLLDVRDRAWDGVRVLGTTLDDAAGEAFDKGARLLGLRYPGGAAIDRLAREGDPTAYAFPVARVPGLDFSFSGLKTALLYAVRDLAPAELEAPPRRPRRELPARDRARARRADRGGGRRRASRSSAASRRTRELRASLPHAVAAPLALCTDNAAMIASAARYTEPSRPPDYLALDAYATAPELALARPRAGGDRRRGSSCPRAHDARRHPARTRRGDDVARARRRRAPAGRRSASGAIVVLRTPSVAAAARRARKSRPRRRSALDGAGVRRAAAGARRSSPRHGLGVRPDYSYARVLDGFSAVARPAGGRAARARTRRSRGVYPVRAAFPATVAPAQARAARRSRRRPWRCPGFDGHGVDDRAARHRRRPHAAVPRRPRRAGHRRRRRQRHGRRAADPQNPAAVERHGTELAGLLVGAGGPDGIHGVAPGATVLPIRVAGWQPDSHGPRRRLRAQRPADRRARPRRRPERRRRRARRRAHRARRRRPSRSPRSPTARRRAPSTARSRSTRSSSRPAGNDGAAGPLVRLARRPRRGARRAHRRRDRPAPHDRVGAPRRCAAGSTSSFDERLPLLGAVAPTRAGRPRRRRPARRRRAGGATASTRAGSASSPGSAALVRAGRRPGRGCGRGVAGGRRRGARLRREPAGRARSASRATSTCRSSRSRRRGACDPRGLRARCAASASRSAARTSEPNPLRGPRRLVLVARALVRRPRSKPDLAAPGIGLATSDPGVAADGEPAFATVNGTSAAAAAVAGAAAVLAQARPDLTARRPRAACSSAPPARRSLPRGGRRRRSSTSARAPPARCRLDDVAGLRPGAALARARHRPQRLDPRRLVVRRWHGLDGSRVVPPARRASARVVQAPHPRHRASARAAARARSTCTIAVRRAALARPVGDRVRRTRGTLLRARRSTDRALRRPTSAGGARVRRSGASTPAAVSRSSRRRGSTCCSTRQPAAFVGVLARQHDLLPGTYPFGITGRVADRADARLRRATSCGSSPGRAAAAAGPAALDRLHG